MKAVFTDPGRPSRGGEEDLGEWEGDGEMNTDVRFEVGDDEEEDGGRKKSRKWRISESEDEAQDEQDQSHEGQETRNRRSMNSNQNSDHPYGEEEEEESSAPSAPLLSSNLANNLLLGQPKYPARSGRDQLNGMKRLVKSHENSGTRRADGDESGEERNTGNNLMVKSNGAKRWCKKCNGPKPDRSHHCSSCGRCVLRVSRCVEKGRSIIIHGSCLSRPLTFALSLFSFP